MTDLREALTVLADQHDKDARTLEVRGAYAGLVAAHRGFAAEVRALLAADERAETPRDGWREGWEACRSQMVKAANAHAEMVAAKGGQTPQGAAAMAAVLWLASLMEKAQPPIPAAVAPRAPASPETAWPRCRDHGAAWPCAECEKDNQRDQPMAPSNGGADEAAKK